MFSQSNSEHLQTEVRARSAAVKRDIQCACDAAFLRLRDKERQLLRLVDLVTWRQQGDLWASRLLRQQHQQMACPPPLPVPALSLSLDTELLHTAIQEFASIRLDGAVTSSRGVTSSSLPDGLEEYGAEEHLVSHKPLPGEPGSVRVTRPPSLDAYRQYYPYRHMSSASSLTSGGDMEKFEFIGDMPGKIFRSDPIDIDEAYINVTSSPPRSSGREERDGALETASEGRGEMSALVAHPLQHDKQAWLLPGGAARVGTSSGVPSPIAQWHRAHASDQLFRPSSTTPAATTAASAATAGATTTAAAAATAAAATAATASPIPATSCASCSEEAALAADIAEFCAIVAAKAGKGTAETAGTAEAATAATAGTAGTAAETVETTTAAETAEAIEAADTAGTAVTAETAGMVTETAAEIDDEKRRWLLHHSLTSAAPSPCEADAASACAQGVAAMVIGGEDNSHWLMAESRPKRKLKIIEPYSCHKCTLWRRRRLFEDIVKDSLCVCGCGDPACVCATPSGDGAAVEMEEEASAVVPDLLAPFRQIENTTAWVSPRARPTHIRW